MRETPGWWPVRRSGDREARLDRLAGNKVERRPWVLHPFLIGIFPIMSVYAHNVYETSFSAVLVPIVVALASTLVAWLAIGLASRDLSRAGLATSMLVVAFFCFKRLDDGFGLFWERYSHYWVYSRLENRPVVVLSMMGIALMGGFWVIFRRLAQPARWTRVLNVFALILVMMPTVSSVAARTREPAGTQPGSGVATASKRGWTPDIYFIILDGYARGDVMKDLYGFDNAPFLDHLERLGFFVARQSHSNYCQTRLSLASTLNASYLENITTVGGDDLLPIAELIKDNLVRKSLRPLGYQFVSFASGYDATELTDADRYLVPLTGNPEFSQLILEITPIDVWLSEFRHEDRFSAIRDRTEYTLDRLPSIARIKGPTFTFAHILGPHPPFVFGEHGEDISPRRLFAKSRSKSLISPEFGSPNFVREAYRQESIYLTERVERTIEQILARSPEPPVIILQSDHGSWLRYHPDDVAATDIHERFGILNAIYLPDRKPAEFSDHMTSVNTFRTILNEIIGANLPLLPERNEFSPFHLPLQFTDVTERLHSPQERLRTFTYPDKYYGLDQQF